VNERQGSSGLPRGTEEFFFAYHHSFGKGLGSRAAGRIGWC